MKQQKTILTEFDPDSYPVISCHLLAIKGSVRGETFIVDLPLPQHLPHTFHIKMERQEKYLGRMKL